MTTTPTALLSNSKYPMIRLPCYGDSICDSMVPGDIVDQNTTIVYVSVADIGVLASVVVELSPFIDYVLLDSFETKHLNYSRNNERYIGCCR